MNALQLRSGFQSKKTLLCYLSVFSLIAPIALPIGILSAAHSAEAQGILIAGRNRGAGQVLKKTVNMLEALFGLGSEVLKRLPEDAPQSSLTSRQLWLIEAVRAQQYMHYRQSGGYLIPLNPRTLNILMSRVGAYPHEADFVATAMYYFGSR